MTPRLRNIVLTLGLAVAALAGASLLTRPGAPALPPAPAGPDVTWGNAADEALYRAIRLRLEEVPAPDSEPGGLRESVFPSHLGNRPPGDALPGITQWFDPPRGTGKGVYASAHYVFHPYSASARASLQEFNGHHEPGQVSRIEIDSARAAGMDEYWVLATTQPDGQGVGRRVRLLVSVTAPRNGPRAFELTKLVMERARQAGIATDF